MNSLSIEKIAETICLNFCVILIFPLLWIVGICLVFKHSFNKKAKAVSDTSTPVDDDTRENFFEISSFFAAISFPFVFIVDRIRYIRNICASKGEFLIQEIESALFNEIVTKFKVAKRRSVKAFTGNDSV